MRVRVALVLCLALCTPRIAQAVHATVPDNYPTIQAAINAHVDTVNVRPGDYPEALTSTSCVSLVALMPVYPHKPMPRITSFNINVSSNCIIPLRLDGLRFGAPVQLHYIGEIRVEGCWFESGVTVSAGNGGYFRRNIVQGNLDLNNSFMECCQNTVLGGTLSSDPATSIWLHDNVVVGPATTGILCHDDAHTVRNYVRGCVTGIESAFDASSAVNNVIEDCSGTGLRAYRGSSTGAQPITGNVIRRCDRGIELSYVGFPGGGVAGKVTGNVIEDSHDRGIVASNSTYGTSMVLDSNTVRSSAGRGMDIGGAFQKVQGNRILESGGDGLVLAAPPGQAALVSGNMVGHSNGRGIVATGPATYRSNTSYSNQLAGYDLSGNAADSLDHNIAFGNGGAGLKWSGVVPVMGCNDWFGNLGGNTTGVAFAASDVSLDPLFCQYESDDVGLTPGSPLASLAGCGQVGALGVGCFYTAVGPGSAAHPGLLNLAVMPTPAHGSVRFGWSALGAGGELAIFDVTGQRRWSKPLLGAQGELTWAVVGSNGEPLAPGVYFARLTTGGRTATKRVVVTP